MYCRNNEADQTILITNHKLLQQIEQLFIIMAQGYYFVLISKICAYFQGQCLRKRECAYFLETCLFLSLVLILKFLVEWFHNKELLTFW